MLALFIVLPVLMNISVFILTPLLIYLVYLFGKKATLPDTFLLRYGPFITSVIFTLVVWLITASVNGGDFSGDNYGLIVFLPFFYFFFVAEFTGSFWLLPVLVIICHLFFTACFAFGTWRSQRFKTAGNKKAFPVLALILALAAVATVQGCVQRRNVLHDDPSHPEVEELGQGQWRLELDYRPFQAQSGARLISPKTPPSLQIDHDYPVLDGAEALIPIYAAAANAIYKADVIRDGENTRGKTVRFSQSSPAAYKALLDGEADMIFAAAPSDEQKQEAAAKGLSYTLTPIGREAFVFLVNEQNPVKSLSVEQLRDIYSGKINDWKDVGGAPEKIMAFQRNEGSGSQTAMLRGVMRGTPMRKPLEAEYVGGMGGLLRGVAGYRNFGNAIGYSFRYYATAMNSVPGIRLLAVNGIEPTVENIRNGSYPFTNDFYIVTVRPPSENAARLRDWFVSDEGQQFIAEAGYVPLRGGSR
ncbi:MAG: substrate-binding domain-containing protein [Desulfovibrionaceae bacterium]|nr:substrate-binding domain-containing protein [Desulfovibrionaceae bacterium]